MILSMAFHLPPSCKEDLDLDTIIQISSDEETNPNLKNGGKGLVPIFERGNLNYDEKPVIFISSDSDSKNGSNRFAKDLSSSTYVDLGSESDDFCHAQKFSLRKQSVSPTVTKGTKRKRRKSNGTRTCGRNFRRDHYVAISSSSEDDLPNLTSPIEKISNILYQYSSPSLQEAKIHCICTLQQGDRLFCPQKQNVCDHMVLAIKPCDKENTPADISIDSPSPMSIGFRRRISEEKQAGSSPVRDSFVTYSEKSEEDDTLPYPIQRIKRESVHDLNFEQTGKCRISDERQAVSLPSNPVSIGILPEDCETIKCDLEKVFLKELDPVDFEPKNKILGLKLESQCPFPNQTNFLISPEIKKEKKVYDFKCNSSLHKLKFEDSNDCDLKRTQNELCSLKGSNISIRKNNMHEYLERNNILCLYYFTYLPFHIMPSPNQLSLSQSSLITTLFENGYPAGLSVLEDLTSKYTPEEAHIKNLIEVIFKGEEEYKILNLTYSVLLSLLQSVPNFVSLPGEKLISALSDKRHKDLCGVEKHILPLRFIIWLFEFNIFTLNLCDSGNMKRSLAHSLLSPEEGKQNLVSVFREIGDCTRKKTLQRKNKRNPSESLLPGKFTRLSFLQHLIHLGLLSSKDMMNSCIILGKDLRPLYKTLSMIQDKIIFLECVEQPLLCISLISEIMETLLIAIPEEELKLSFIAMVQCFTESVHSKIFLTSVDYEERIILLYFYTRSIVQTKQERILEPIRTKLISRGSLSGSINPKEKILVLQNLDDWFYHILKECSNLTIASHQFFLYTKCLIDSLNDV